MKTMPQTKKTPRDDFRHRLHKALDVVLDFADDPQNDSGLLHPAVQSSVQCILAAQRWARSAAAERGKPMSITLTPESGMRFAVEMYRIGKPVIVFTSGKETILHGKEDLQVIADTDCPQDATVIELPVTLVQWEASDWPEIFEAARQLYMRGQLRPP